ncbi:MAG: efflux RND transporter permease subunit, partial [Pseudomonadales bacterium]|nr:efflux RND transporter permease subunit [Pseudomonadales bacterium]
MLLSDISVKRPVFATVLNILLVVFGLIAFQKLPLRGYPDISPPVVSVDTKYPGASAAVVEAKITQILEDQLSGIDSLINIESSSTDGRSQINLEFRINRNIDAAANDVREAVSRVVDRLPDEAKAPEVSKADITAQSIAWFTLASDRLSPLELSDYVNRYVVDRFKVIEGVARVTVWGERKFVMRIALDRRAMAARGVTVDDVEKALRAENIELPAGNIESLQREFVVRVARVYNDADDFSQLVVKQGEDKHLVRLGEIARVELGAHDYKSSFRGNGENMVGIGLIKQSKANTIGVMRDARKVKDELEKSLPPGIKIRVMFDSAVFLERSIEEVYQTLLITMILVILVIYFFIGSIRATFIPAITVPVSIIASFSVLYLAGFSINLLTLLAGVLAIGLVVDDTIVVLENVHRRIEQGESRLRAAFLGTREVGFAVIATTLVLVAVFVPIIFMEGHSGRLFSEFALAMSAAVVCSSFVALT